MADIVSSLFGLSPLPGQEIEQQARARDLELGSLYGNAIINPYGDPQAQNLLAKQQASQFALGGALTRGLGGMFGLKTPELKRATDYESILQSTQQELGDQVNNPAVLYPALQQKLAQAGFTREAMQVGMIGQKAIQEAGLNRAKVMSEQAQQQKLQQEALIKQQEVDREEQLRNSLASLPVNATDDEYLDVVRRFAPAKDVMSVLEKKQIAAEARQAKTQDLQMRLEEETKRAQERNDTLLEQARIQGANSAMIAKMRLDGQAQIQQMRADSARQLAELKSSSTALNTGAPKDVAEAEASLAGIDLVTKEMKKAKDLLTSGKAKFGVKENTIASVQNRVGNPNENTRNQLEVKRQIREGVNNLLLLAKGTQTEGDARRAQELYVSAETANSNDAWQAAMDALLRTQEKLKAEKSTYIKARGFGNSSNKQTRTTKSGVTYTIEE